MNHLGIVKFLSDLRTVDVNARDSLGRTPLQDACNFGCLEVVRFFTDLPTVDVNSQDEHEGYTPHHIAARKTTGLAVLKFLIDLPCCCECAKQF